MIRFGGSSEVVPLIWRNETISRNLTLELQNREFLNRKSIGHRKWQTDYESVCILLFLHGLYIGITYWK